MKSYLTKFNQHFVKKAGESGEIFPFTQTATATEDIKSGQLCRVWVDWLTEDQIDFTGVTKPGSVYSFDVDPSETYMAVSSSTGDYLRIYKIVNDVASDLLTVDVQPTGTPRGIKFSPDGNYLAVAHQTTPYISVYKRTGDNFVKLANPTTLPDGNCFAINWNPQGTHIAVSLNTVNPYTNVFKLDNDVLTKLSVPAGSSSSLGIAYNPAGDRLFVGFSGLTTYSISGDTYTKLANATNYIGGTSKGLACYNNNNIFKSQFNTRSLVNTAFSHDGVNTVGIINPLKGMTDIPSNAGFINVNGDFVVHGLINQPSLYAYYKFNNWVRIEVPILPVNNTVEAKVTTNYLFMLTTVANKLYAFKRKSLEIKATTVENFEDADQPFGSPAYSKVDVVNGNQSVFQTLE